MHVATTPSWVRALGSVVRRMPRGRYRVVSSLRSSTPPFIATLGRDAGGALFECDLADEIAREVCLTGCYEPPVTRLLQRRLRGGASMIDVGANWGYFTLLAAAAVGPAGSVVALEPDPRQFARLASNARLNNFTHVTPVMKAAAAGAGSAVLLGYAEGAGNRGVSRLAVTGDRRPTTDDRRPTTDQRPATGDFDVECVTVDAIAAHLRRVDVVKIDVEGAEGDVLHGMRDGLAAQKYRAIVLELHPAPLRDRGVSADVCVRAIQDAGYRGWTIDQSPRTYRSAADPRIASGDLVRPLDRWREQPWPHLLWLAPGEDLA